jgi:chloride channel protein, CIC family
LRAIVFRRAETGQTRLPVVERENGRVAGMISLHDLPGARVRNLNEERHRERVLQLRLPLGKESAPEDNTAQPERNQ